MMGYIVPYLRIVTITEMTEASAIEERCCSWSSWRNNTLSLAIIRMSRRCVINLGMTSISRMSNFKFDILKAYKKLDGIVYFIHTIEGGVVQLKNLDMAPFKGLVNGS